MIPVVVTAQCSVPVGRGGEWAVLQRTRST